MDKVQASIEKVMRELQQEAPSSSGTITKVVRKEVTSESEHRIPAVKPPTSVKPSDGKRVFVVVTEDYSGLGWAKKLLEEGEQVVLASAPSDAETEDETWDKKVYDKVGQGWVPKMTLTDALAKLKGPHTYWLFAENHHTDIAEQLRKAGQKVFGTSKLGERMEHDRDYAVKVAKDAGLDSPEGHGFTSVKDGLAFLDANPDTAYVFKPDDAKSSHLTTVPFRERSRDANRELYHYLDHLTEDPGSFILQERKYGVEVNVEAWVYEGKAFFSFVTLENKRKGNRNSGEMIGCAGDVTWPLDMKSKLFTETIGKLLPFYAKEHYTGFADVNVIIGDNAVWFLEVGNRFGYNSHPNLFLALALDGFGSILADFIDGKTKGMPDRFRKGFGASISLNIDHTRPGLPLHLHEDHVKRFYPYDGYKEGDDLLLSGWSNDVGIITDFDYTLQGAADNVFQKFYYGEAVSFSDMFYRDDLGQRDYQGSPIQRYEALQAMGLLS